jgi:hypothetical protein
MSDNGQTGPDQEPQRMRPVIFLHIPKAAGTTLQVMFRRRYRGFHIHNLTGNPDDAAAFVAMPEADRHDVDVLMGHQHFGMHEWLRPGARYVTMLRNPLDRCISHYYYVLRMPDHHLHQRVVNEKMSLYDYVAMGTTHELDNDQVRWLNEAVHRDVPFGSVTREMLEIAKRRLIEDIEVIGLSEQFDESLRLMGDALGWDDISYTRENVSANRPKAEEVEPRAIELIREHNELDYELYDLGVRLFSERVGNGAAAG